MKRKQPASPSAADAAILKKRRTAHQTNGEDAPSPKRSRTNDNQYQVKDARVAESTPKRSKKRQTGPSTDEDDTGTPTPKPDGITLFDTPRKVNGTPLRLKKADQSAKRKSAKSLLENRDGDGWEGEADLAQEILNDGYDELEQEDEPNLEELAQKALQTTEEDGLQPAETPSKRGRGRPKGAKNKRSPTPEGDIPPEERYFFQNRSGPPQISSNTMASVNLLTHEEYFEQMRLYEEDHLPEKAYLVKLYARSFPQWLFELQQGFNICLYGWGSKRALSARFADWVHARSNPKPAIVVVNGYTPKLNIRSVLAVLASVVMGDAMPPRLVGQPHEVTDTVLTYLSEHPPLAPIIIVVNSIDAQPLRKGSTQNVLARIAAHSSIQLIATSDTPTVALLWNSSLLDQFKFLFHDCTTYAPYDAELNVVDDVHELLGRKGRRIGGKEGVGFVLKSLPENARNLYRVLLTEILSVLSDGHDFNGDEDPDGQDRAPRKQTQDAENVGIEYRSLYQKASEEFICSSDMNFRFLLKEFHDHQMITSSRDASGTEVLGVPLAREEMEGVLEDLVLG
jgi:origin recognition complex subunit 2